MKVIAILWLLLLLPVICIGQITETSAATLRKDGNLQAAIKIYKKEHLKRPNDWKNTYNLACAYALTFQKDSAYHYLSIALKQDTSLWALADSDLYALIDDPRWSRIENEQISRFQKENKELEQPEYAKKLLTIILKDQALDYYVDQAKSYYMKQGTIPQWHYPIAAFKQQIAQENYETIVQLIEQYGWPTYSQVGTLAADAPLLVINHHKSDEIRKKYLSQIEKTCLDKEGSCMEYAKIQDRILVGEDKFQRYGMQFRYNAQGTKLEPFPIMDPEYVDQRRAKIGLEPLKDYLKRKINYHWAVVQKKK